MDIGWDDARLFLAVAEASSVSAAAQALSITQPTASRRLAQLEARIGEPLFVRSVTGVTLTPFGERWVEPARRMAEWAGELSRTAERRETAVDGCVRISAPPGFAYELVVPFAAWLREKLPSVRIEIASSIRYVDLVRREADLALRMVRPSQRDLEVVASLAFQALPFASRDYVRTLGPRPRPADVRWIGWAPPHDDTPPMPLLARAIPGFVPAFSSDDFLVQTRAAELGLGAIVLGRMRHRFARETSLVELHVAGIPEITTGIHLVCAKRALDVPRIRAVADLLASVLREADASSTRRSKIRPRAAAPRRTR